MAEAKVSNCLLIIILLLTAIMFVWTINTLTNVNKTIVPTAVSAFSA